MADQDNRTLGQKYAGVGFNPSQDSDVDKVKQQYADLIDFHNDALQGETDGEKIRLHKMAITDLQKVQMVSVKAITWQ